MTCSTGKSRQRHKVRWAKSEVVELVKKNSDRAQLYKRVSTMGSVVAMKACWCVSSKGVDCEKYKV